MNVGTPDFILGKAWGADILNDDNINEVVNSQWDHTELGVLVHSEARNYIHTGDCSHNKTVKHQLYVKSIPVATIGDRMRMCFS